MLIEQRIHQVSTEAPTETAESPLQAVLLVTER
jgi:hypothetical protein